MEWSRRDFLAFLSALPAGALAQAPSDPRPSSWLYPETEKTGYSVLQGMTDATTAQFSVVVGRHEVLSFEIQHVGARGSGWRMTLERHRPDHSDYGVYKLRVTGLALGERYHLVLRSESGTEVDRREFQTLDLGRSSARIALMSCMLDALHRDDVWGRLRAEEPDVVFFLGDSVYADRNSLIGPKSPADPEKLWRRYGETRQRLAFYYWRRLVPVIAVWDDHDFGANDSGAWYPHKDEARIVFETFFAQGATPDFIRGPGIASRLSAFGMDFFFLDGRTFRGQPKTAGQRLFGAGQTNWFFNHLGGRPSLLLSGSLFFGGYTSRESFEGQYPADFRDFLARLKNHEAPVAFASGDVHFSELMDIEAAQLGYPSFELVASSMHSYTFPGHHNRWRNDRRREATSSHNFVILETNVTRDSLKAEVTCLSANDIEFRGTVSLNRATP